jgi:hypothetical protein
VVRVDAGSDSEVEFPNETGHKSAKEPSKSTKDNVPEHIIISNVIDSRALLPIPAGLAGLPRKPSSKRLRPTSPRGDEPRMEETGIPTKKPRPPPEKDVPVPDHLEAGAQEDNLGNISIDSLVIADMIDSLNHSLTTRLVPHDEIMATEKHDELVGEQREDARAALSIESARPSFDSEQDGVALSKMQDEPVVSVAGTSGQRLAPIFARARILEASPVHLVQHDEVIASNNHVELVSKELEETLAGGIAPKRSSSWLSNHASASSSSASAEPNMDHDGQRCVSMSNAPSEDFDDAQASEDFDGAQASEDFGDALASGEPSAGASSAASTSGFTSEKNSEDEARRADRPVVPVASTSRKPLASIFARKSALGTQSAAAPPRTTKNGQADKRTMRTPGQSKSAQADRKLREAMLAGSLDICSKQ